MAPWFCSGSVPKCSDSFNLDLTAAWSHCAPPGACWPTFSTSNLSLITNILAEKLQDCSSVTDILPRLDQGGRKKKRSLSVAADWLKVSQGVIVNVAVIQEGKWKHMQSESIFDFRKHTHRHTHTLHTFCEVTKTTRGPARKTRGQLTCWPRRLVPSSTARRGEAKARTTDWKF